MKTKLIIILLFTAKISFAQLSPFEYNGYAKYLFSTSKIPRIDDRLNDNLIHLRLNTKWYATESLTAALEIRFRAFYGESVERIPNFSELIQTKHDFAELDAILWESEKSLGYIEADRLWIEYIKDNLQATLGRQRVAWGTCWVWNPTDLFNPKNVLNFDYEELPATDAIRVQYYTSPVTKLDFTYQPAKNPENQILAGLWSLNESDYDINLIAGMRFKKWLTGFSWAGDILDAGFRGEILVSQAPNEPDTNSIYGQFGQSSLSSWDKPLVSIALSGDYTFQNTFYIHTEILYNNNGKSSNTLLFQEEALLLGMLSAARLSIYQEFAYDITPLLRSIIYGIFNPDDKSFVVVPSLSYSIITNLDLYLICLFFDGEPLTQYGEYGTSFYARIKYSF
ncbi:MAG: hypothetical protein MUE91_03370 [Ignavibacteriaceae bacterium]|jgi:hypothetical protein|nr:hypothetical protein [Ignavibacterium sp.]MCU0413433.1 hypothetical protein [Ignavibacteriaceae bacterium]